MSNTADKEALFIPSGMDAIELIDQIDLNMYLQKIKKQL
jgi:hypothetical protein